MKSDDRIRYEYLQSLFTILREELDMVFSSKDWDDVHQYLDHGEEGLAAQTVVWIVQEERKIISVRAAAVIGALFRFMDLDFEDDIKFLRAHVTL